MIFDRVDAALARFTATAQEAAGAAAQAGTSIDASLLQTASGADALELADARVAAAQAALTAAQSEQAAAERALLDAQAQAAAASDADAAAWDVQVAAADRLQAAETRTAAATKALSDAQSVQARTATAAAAESDAAGAAAGGAKTAASGAETGFLGMSSGMSKAALAGAAVAVGVGIVGAASVKMAADFQDSTTHLVTDAGETQQNLGMVQAGILRIASSTGTAANDLSNAMYHIESSGYHGAQGLQILQTAAEGAKVGGADFDTVAKTLTGTMNSYNMTGDQSVTMMNELIATVGAGDMRMQDLASSLGNVAPLAAAAHLSFAQVGGAIATMTAQNMSAQQATQDLANTIRALQSPNNVAIQEMQQLGLNSNDVAQNLGKRGLTGTLDMLTQAVAAHTQGGQVLISTFQASAQAAQDANQMIAAMPPNLQTLAKSYLDGSVTSKQWTADLKGLDPVSAHLMGQFATLADKTHSFNNLLSSGSPAAQTFNAAMGKLMGGATGLNTALMLTSGRMATFQANVNTVAAAATKGGNQVDNWATIQGTFNQRMAEAKQSVSAAAISLGMALLPAVSAVLGAVAGVLVPVSQWIATHRTLTAIILISVGTLGGLVATILVALAVFNKVKTAVNAVSTVLNLLRSGFITSAAQAVASAAQTAASWAASAAQMAADGAVWVAESIGNIASVVASHVAGAASTLGSWIATGASMLAQGAVWVAESIAKIAIVVASNVAGALATAAAWVAANAAMTLGIGLLVAAIVAAVVFIVTHWQQVASFFESLWSHVVSFATTAFQNMINFVGSIPGRIMSIFAGAGSWLLSVGENLLYGLWNGIASAFQWVWQQIQGIVGSIIGAFKSLLGIHSPSQVMADEVGRYIPAGIAAGITANMGAVAQAAKLAGQQAVTGAQIGVSLGGGAGLGLPAMPPAASLSSTPQITIDLRGSQVMSDRDTDVLVDKIGRALATRILPSGGVRLTM